MTSISTSISLLQFNSSYPQSSICTGKHEISLKWLSPSYSKRNQPKWKIGVLRNSARSDDERSGDIRERSLMDLKPINGLKETIISLSPVFVKLKRHITPNFAVGLSISIVFVVIALREFMARQYRYNHHGSVADLVKRGQLRSDRRGISQPLKYDDPFNNPMVRVCKGNSTVEMCGKIYRLAPVTLTEEEQSSHQKRRLRAYQWKRPTIFLKEGEAIPADVDPETIRWIPANHPFATTISDIDEDLAQNNVYQKHGVPFRIRAEHEALQKKLEKLQNEQKLSSIGVDPSDIRDFERPHKPFSNTNEHLDQSSANYHGGQPNCQESDGNSRFH